MKSCNRNVDKLTNIYQFLLSLHSLVAARSFVLELRYEDWMTCLSHLKMYIKRMKLGNNNRWVKAMNQLFIKKKLHRSGDMGKEIFYWYCSISRWRLTRIDGIFAAKLSHILYIIWSFHCVALERKRVLVYMLSAFYLGVEPPGIKLCKVNIPLRRGF